MTLRRYRDLGIRTKLLAPFLVLMIVWGGFGSYVLARGRAGEASGQATARLAETLNAARASFATVERSLMEAARLASNTEGMGTALEDVDRAKLRRLILPLAVNASSTIAAVDRIGRVVYSVDAAADPPAIKTSGTIGDPAVVRAARGIADERGDMWSSASGERFRIAAPVRRRGDVVGAIVASIRWEEVAHRLITGADARVALFAGDGSVLVSTTPVHVPFRDAGGGFRSTVGEGDARLGVLYAPLEARGERLATIAVTLPAGEAYGNVGKTAALLSFLVGLAVIIATGIGLLTARAITRPLSSLLDATRALERGELSARASVSSADEVGTLAATFNRMADQLQASHEGLERKVRERTVELERVNGELARASDAKSSFLATMSHELRTPLNAIIGFADMLSDPAFGRPDVRTTRELAGNILSSGRHLLTLINDVLDLARVEAGRIDVSPEAVDLDEMLTEVLSIVAPLAADKRLRVATTGDSPPGPVMADPARTRQVLFNLVANAIKFTPEGGRVTVEVAHGDGFATLTVADTGSGLAPADMERIFEPFERAEGARGVEGAGLGLALARHLVEAQGGRIWVDATVGAGSRFSFTVPLTEQPVAAAQGRRAG